MRSRITWGVDGLGRAFLVYTDAPGVVVACCPRAGSALYVSLEVESNDKEVREEMRVCSGDR